MSNKQITFKELLKPVNSNDVKISEKINKINRKNASKEDPLKNISEKSTSKTRSKRPGSQDNKANTKSETSTKARATSDTKTPKKASLTKVAKTTSKNKTSRVSFTQDELDKLCEVYDWYMAIKDLDPLKQVKHIENTNIKIEEDIIKQAKKVSITIDQDVWENFSTLATNISQKKGPLLTEILKEYLLKHRDLY
nr:DNA-binding protein [uncultured Peptostreptococcus sp.]